ncbi:MAG: hypothetical protein ACE5G0_14670 [Rhodothermales bacterium]
MENGGARHHHGHKKLHRFRPVTARKVRLVIEQARTNPTIKQFGLYRARFSIN